MEWPTVQSALNDALDRRQFAGATAAFAHGGRVIAAAGGIVNAQTGVSLKTTTVMHIGSIAKLFTTTLVMQLVDEGHLSLEDKAVKHVPDLERSSDTAKKQITIRMLLNHTSGLDGEMLPDHGHDEETLEKGVARFARLGQLFPPGEGCSYCNAGVCIAGYLAQVVTGQSWYSLVRERIFQPLGMEHAVTLPEEALLHSPAVGHHVNPETGELKRTSRALLPLSFAPGGTTLMMSATDLVTFARAHMADGVGPNGTRILSAESARAMRRMTARFAGIGQARGVGLGWMIFDNGLVGHGGGAPGVVSQLYMHPEKQFAAAVLTNSDNGGTLIRELMTPWLREIADALPYGEPVDLQPPTGDIRFNASPYIGTYEDILLRFRISERPDGLGLTVQEKFTTYDTTSTEESPEIEFIPCGDDIFARHLEAEENKPVHVDLPQYIKFLNLDGSGRMQHLASGVRMYRRTS